METLRVQITHNQPLMYKRNIKQYRMTKLTSKFYIEKKKNRNWYGVDKIGMSKTLIDDRGKKVHQWFIHLISSSPLSFSLSLSLSLSLTHTHTHTPCLGVYKDWLVGGSHDTCISQFVGFDKGVHLNCGPNSPTQTI